MLCLKRGLPFESVPDMLIIYLSGCDKREEGKTGLHISNDPGRLCFLYSRLREGWRGNSGQSGGTRASEETKSIHNSFGTLPDLWRRIADDIILYSLLSYTSFQSHSYASAIRLCTGLVLLIASYLITQGCSSARRLVLIFPLKVIYRWALDDIEKQSAANLLKQWGDENRIDGTCIKAFWSIRYINSQDSSTPIQ